MSPGPKAVRITPVKTDAVTLLSVVLHQTKEVVEVTFGFYEKVILFLLIVINIVICFIVQQNQMLMTQKITDLHAGILTCLALLFHAVESFSLNFKLHDQKKRSRTLKVIFTFDLQNRQILT